MFASKAPLFYNAHGYKHSHYMHTHKLGTDTRRDTGTDTSLWYKPLLKLKIEKKMENNLKEEEME